MKSIKISIVLMLFWALSVRADLTAIVNKFPAQNSQQQQQLVQELLAIDGVTTKLAEQLSTQSGQDAKVRYALGALVLAAGQQADIASQISRELSQALAQASDKQIKGFLLDNLWWIANDQQIQEVAKYLADDYLHFRAVRVLAAIESIQGQLELIRSLARSDDNQRVTTINALTDIESDLGLAEISVYMNSQNIQLSHAAMNYVAQMGSPDVFKVMLEKDVNARASYGLKLAVNGHKDLAVQIAQSLKDNEDAHIRAAAVGILTQAKGMDALADIYQAFSDQNIIVANYAVDCAGRLQSQAAFGWWKDKYSAKPDVYLLKVLAAYDKESVGILAQAISHNDKSLRDVAMELLKQKNSDLVAEIINIVLADKCDEEILSQIIELAAARRIKCFSAAYDHCLESGPARQAQLISRLGYLIADDDIADILDIILAGENKDNANALLRALNQGFYVGLSNKIATDNILARYEQLAPTAKVIALEILGSTGGSQAFTLVLSQVKNDDDAIGQAALRAIYGWPDTFALPSLCQMLLEAEQLADQVRILRAIVRLMPDAAMTPERQIEFYARALAVMTRINEKRIVLAQLSNHPSELALAEIKPLLEDESLAADAALAALKIVWPDRDKNAGLKGDLVAEVLEKIAAMDNQTISTPASNYLRLLKEDAIEQINYDVKLPVGFTRLFNGRDLTGWVGATENHPVIDGVITVKGGGNIYPDAQYADFHLKLQYKVKEGDNNGVGIRTRLNANAAYDGMEIQILENKANQYRNLRAYQYNGSIYGVQPAKRGYARPLDQWNDMEIIARGDHIIVILNDVIITDAYLNDVAPGGKTIDNENHPGLFNKSGYVGLLAHGVGPQFREIYIKTY